MSNFDEFFLILYVLIDDLYRCFAPPEVSGRRHASDAKLSDSELTTIAICGELVGFHILWKNNIVL